MGLTRWAVGGIPAALVCAAAAADTRIDGVIDASWIAGGTEPALSAAHVRARFSVRTVIDRGIALREHWSVGVTADRYADARACASELCAQVPEAEATLTAGWSHYAHGRLDFGRRGGIGPEVVARTHPWGADSVAADPCAAVLRVKCPRHGTSLTYSSPTYDDWTFGGQATVAPGSKSLAARAEFGGDGVYAAAAYTYTKTPDTSRWSLPLGSTYQVGRWRAHAAATFGRSSDGKGRYMAVGATTPWRGGEWRVGASRVRIGNTTPYTKLALGLHVPLTLDLVPFVDLARVRRDGGTTSSAAEVGLRLIY